MTPQFLLRKLRLELLLDCPLRCAHCSANAAPGHPGALPPNLARRLVEEFAALGGVELTITGGEPLLLPLTASLLADASNRGLATVIFTSGIVRAAGGPVAASLNNWMLLAPMLGRAVFSVYAVTPAIHDHLTRTPGSLYMTQAAIRTAVAAGIRTELHIVPTRLNYHELPDLVQEAARLGVAAARVIRYVPHGRGGLNRDDLAVRPAEHGALRILLERVIASGSIPVRVGSGFGHLLMDTPPCTAALEELVVMADGRIHPCSGFTGYRGVKAIGSVVDRSLAEVWSEAPYLQAVRTLLAKRGEAPSIGCHPGCLAQKAITLGRLTDLEPDPDSMAARMGAQVPAGVDLHHANR